MSFITLSSLSFFYFYLPQILASSPSAAEWESASFGQSYKFSLYQRTIVAEFNDGESKLASF